MGSSGEFFALSSSAEHMAGNDGRVASSITPPVQSNSMQGKLGKVRLSQVKSRRIDE